MYKVYFNNSPQYLEAIVKYVTENLRDLIHSPSVQMQDVPPDFFDLDEMQEQAQADSNNMDPYRSRVTEQERETR